MSEREGGLAAAGLKLAVLVTRFNRFVTDRLLDGALDAFARLGGAREELEVVRLPGAYELPLAAKRLALTGRYHALVALAAVIRGATPHFEYVSGAAVNGLSRVSIETGVPIGLGVLTTNTVEQAIERAGAKAGNKGEEAMLAAIEMANLLRSLG